MPPSPLKSKNQFIPSFFDQERARGKILFYILSAFVALAIGIHFRLYPLYFYTSSDASEKATLLVISQLKKSAAQEVDFNNPILPEFQKKNLAKKRFDEFLKKNSVKVRETIDKVAQDLNERNSEKTPPYLLESDAYNYLNLTENIIKTGRLSDETKGSKYFNKLMMAPIGFYEPLNLHPYVGFWVYKFVKIFDPDATVMFAVGFSSLLITALALAAFTLLCYQMRCSVVSTFIASIFLLLAPIFIKRSCYGWYDDDPYNIFFPLMILFSLFCGLEATSLKKRFIYGLLTAGLLLLYAFFWQGWVYIFCIVIFSGIGIVSFRYITEKIVSSNKASKILHQFCTRHSILNASHEKVTLKNTCAYFAIILIATFLCVAAAFGVHDFFILFQEGWKALKEFLLPSLSLWPDMYVSVGELKRSTLAEIIEFTGGVFFLAVGGAGLIHFMVRAVLRPTRFYSIEKMIVISLFFASSLLLTVGAQRFVLLFIIPLGISFALGIHALQEFLGGIRQRFGLFPKAETFHMNALIALILLSSIAIPILNAKKSTLGLLNRIFNETWENVLTKIDHDTPLESIVNSWWPPGHFIKAIAHRKVTFDGATINKPQAYWMANVFLADDERKALGILRMLNVSSNLAVDNLQALGMPLSSTIDLLREITGLNRSDAKRRISTDLNSPQTETLLSLTHGNPPPSYLLVYNELVEKSLVMSFVDRWNFHKIESISKSPELKKLLPGRKSREYIKFLWKIAGGPLNSSGTFLQMGIHNDIVLFENNIQIDLKTMACKVQSNEFGKGIPKSVVFLKDGQIVEQKLPNASLFYSIVLLEEAGRYSCIVMDPRLANSLLVKFYYFDGQGLKYFHPFTKESDLTKRTQISVFSIDWVAFLKDIGETQ